MDFAYQHAAAETPTFAFEDDSMLFGDTFDFKFNLNELSPLAPDTVLALQSRAYDISDYNEKLRAHDHILKFEAGPPATQPRASRQQLARPRPVRKRKLKRDANDRPPAAKPPRKLNKAKIEELRVQIDVLQQQLTGLQERCHQRYSQALADAKSGRLLKSKSKWFTKAAMEYKKLQKSKAHNQKLKASLSKLAQANTTLGALFQNEAAHEDLLAMRDSSSEVSSAECVSSEAEDVAADLVRLYDATDSILKEIQTSNGTNTAFVTENSTHDAALGTVFEMKSSTPVLGGDFYMLGEFLWSYVTTAARIDEDHGKTQPAPLESNAPNDFVHKEYYTLTPETQSGTFDVPGVAFARKFDTPDRTVFTVVSTVRVPGSDLTIHQDSWVVASDHSGVAGDASDSQGSTGKSTWVNALHRLSIKTSDSLPDEKWMLPTGPVNASTSPEQCVVKALSNRIRERQQLVQQVLGMF